MTFHLNTSERHAENSRVSERIARYAEQLGYAVSTSASGISASNYLECWRDGQSVRVRIANHDARPTYERINGAADIEVRTQDGPAAWMSAVRRLAELAGLPAPAKLGAIERAAETRASKEATKRLEATRERKADAIARLRALIESGAEPVRVSKRRREWSDARGPVAFRSAGYVWLYPGRCPAEVGAAPSGDALRALLAAVEAAPESEF